MTIAGRTARRRCNFLERQRARRVTERKRPSRPDLDRPKATTRRGVTTIVATIYTHLLLSIELAIVVFMAKMHAYRNWKGRPC